MKKSLLLLSILIYSISAKSQTEPSIANSGKVWASIFQQRSAEYRALCFQAYNMAKMRIDLAVLHRHKKPLAVITDIDETLLENSPYDAGRAVNNNGYDATTWKQWTAQAIADTVPGAAAFFKYAAKRGVAVYYVTNRDEDEREGTLNNLRKYKLPNADNAHLLLRQGSSSKEPRRQDILKTHNVVLLCGDNLADFDALYDNHPSEENRTPATEKLRKEFGSRYIVLPNPEYGDWENALFQYKRFNETQRDSVIKAKLITVGN